MKTKNTLLKAIICCLAFITAICVMPENHAYAATTNENWKYETDDGFRYSVDAAGVVIVDYVGTAEHLEIPAYIDGKAVTRLGGYSFAESTFKTVTIPNTVTNIATGSFTECDNLESAYIPDSVTIFGGHVFYHCDSLKEARLSKKAKSIGEAAFSDCPKLESVEIPAGVTEILTSAFQNCTALRSVSIPETVTYLGYYGFEGCTSLENVDLPDSLTYLGPSCFHGCTSLKSVKIPLGLTWLDMSTFDFCKSLKSVTLSKNIKDIGHHAFRLCESLTDVYYIGTKVDFSQIGFGDNNYYFTGANIHYADLTDGLEFQIDKSGITISDYNGTDTNVFMPSYIYDYPIIAIGESAFASTKIVNVAIPDTVKEIGPATFSSCKYIESITLPKGITSIGKRTFNSCEKLKTIFIPDTVKEIGQEAFAYCLALENIDLPKSVEVIGKSAFSNCIKLKSIKIPEKVKKIESYTFMECTALETIYLPEAIETIDKDTFFICPALKNTYYDGTLDKWTKVENNDSHSALKDSNIVFTGTAHEHTWVPSTVLKESTCTVPGEQLYICSCGKDKIEALPKAVHKGVRPTAVPPACTTGGLEKGYVCKVCGMELEPQETTAPLGHSYTNDCDDQCNVCGAKRDVSHDYEWVIDKAAECLKSGLKYKECKNCHDMIEGNTIIPALGHAYDNQCDNKCNVCNATDSTRGHSYVWTVIDERNCGKDGYQVQKCEVCDAQGQGKVLGATGNHLYKWITVTEPTCGTAGSKSQICTVCQLYNYSTINTRIEPTGKHVYSNGCDASCNDCGTIRATTHDCKTTTVKATLKKDGSITKVCNVCNVQVSKETVKYPKTFKLSATSYTYDGKVKKPTVKVYDANGKLISATNYKVTYASGCKNVGKYTVKVSFTGNVYSGSKSVTFTINPKGTSISKLTKAKKAFTVKWAKQFAKMAKSRITGYEVRYSLSKKMSSAKTVTVKGYSVTSKKISKLKAKKTYYVQIRTYTTVNGVKYYSGWSTAKSVKTK